MAIGQAGELVVFIDTDFTTEDERNFVHIILKSCLCLPTIYLTLLKISPAASSDCCGSCAVWEPATLHYETL